MRHASSGDPAAIGLFFELLLNSKLFVPQRKQNASFKNIASYPNDFFNFLALNFEESVFVPAFITLEQMSEWAGNELEYREIESSRLFEIMPSDWWLILNPGCEIHKDISPWEIERLKKGTKEIPEIVEELLSAKEFEGFSVETPDQSEFTDLKLELTKQAEQEPHIRNLYLLKEQGLAQDENVTQRLLIGFELIVDDPNEARRIEEQLQLLCDRAQIGAEKVRVMQLSQNNHSAKGIFFGVQPFFSRSPGFLAGLGGKLKKLLNIAK